MSELSLITFKGGKASTAPIANQCTSGDSGGAEVKTHEVPLQALNRKQIGRLTQ